MAYKQIGIPIEMEHRSAFMGYKYDTHSFMLLPACLPAYRIDIASALLQFSDALMFRCSLSLLSSFFFVATSYYIFTLYIDGGDLHAHKCGPLCGINMLQPAIVYIRCPRRASNDYDDVSMVENCHI